MLIPTILKIIDDDHRVVLESISDSVDCEHDYINATYIDVRLLENVDVRPLKITLQMFAWLVKSKFINSLPILTLLKL